MDSSPSSAEKNADLQALVEAIHAATDADIEELARNLLNTDDEYLFGDNEFTIRALAHRIAAKALEQHLTRKKTATRAPA
jgi:hypothetical protein